MGAAPACGMAARFVDADANVSFVCKLAGVGGMDGVGEVQEGKALHHAERDRLLAFLDTAMNGVSGMSDDFPGVTDTSSNLGVLALAQGAFKATFKVRSLLDARADALADKLISFAGSYALHAWKEGPIRAGRRTCFRHVGAVPAGVHQRIRPARQPAGDPRRT